MFVLSVFALSIALFAQGSDINPFDLEDEIRQQAGDLKSSVQGAIFSALGCLDDIINGVYYHRNNKLDEAAISMNQEFHKLDNQLTTIENQAADKNQNIDACLASEEPIFNQISPSFLECSYFTNREVMIIESDAKYYIDTLMEEVNIFDYQIDICAGDFLCLSSLTTDIEQALVYIPQKIEVEVKKASELCEDLKVEIAECTDSKIAQYIVDGNKILEEITICVDNLLS